MYSYSHTPTEWSREKAAKSRVSQHQEDQDDGEADQEEDAAPRSSGTALKLRLYMQLVV